MPQPKRRHLGYIYTDEQIAAIKAEMEKLRKALWLRHGCPISSLYGDDGEMQCSGCGIDFKRMSADGILWAFSNKGKAKLESVEDVKKFWDNSWKDYLKAVKEQGLEERHAPPGFWNRECDY
jgi:hypothetical protein